MELNIIKLSLGSILIIFIFNSCTNHNSKIARHESTVKSTKDTCLKVIWVQILYSKQGVKIVITKMRRDCTHKFQPILKCLQLIV